MMATAHPFSNLLGFGVGALSIGGSHLGSAYIDLGRDAVGQFFDAVSCHSWSLIRRRSAKK
jgi:hypothetical protein